MRLMRRLLLVAVAVSVGVAAPARAEDLDPPVIHHSSPARAFKGDSITISAQMEDESEIFAPTLYFRYPGSRGYSSMAMVRKGDSFVAVIQATADVDYWIEAYDEYGNGPTREGTPDRPLRVEVVERAPEKVVSRPEPMPQPQPQPEVQPVAQPEPEKPAFDPKEAVAEVKPTPPPETYQPPPVVTPAGPRPFYNQWWFYTAAGAVTAGVVTGVIIAAQPDPIYRNTVGASVGRTSFR